MENILRSELEMVRGMITSERQRAYYDYMIDSAKDVICVPLAEVFTPEQTDYPAYCKTTRKAMLSKLSFACYLIPRCLVLRRKGNLFR